MFDVSLRLNCQYLQCLITYLLDKLFEHSKIPVFEKDFPSHFRLFKNFSNVHHLCYSSLPHSPHAIPYHPNSNHMMPVATLDSNSEHTHAFNEIKMTFLKIFLKIHCKALVSYSHFHNILRLFDVLPNFPFTTSETMRDYYL